MLTEFRVAIIGLGEVVQAQFQGFASLENLRIVSVCDVLWDKTQAVAQQYGAKAYADHQTLLNNGRIDLVMVLTPASTHREIVEAAAKASIHVFCEKPLAVTLEDSEAMVATCKNAGVKLFYGSCYRYLPAVRRAFELIQSGVIGDIQLMTEQLIGGRGLDAYRELPPVHYPLRGPGGPGMGLVDHGIHLIDVFSWFAQSEIESVQGKGLVSGGSAGSEFMVMQFANGATGHLLYNAATYSTSLPGEGIFNGGQGWLADGTIAETGFWESQPSSISVYGTKGSLRIFHYANALFLNVGAGAQRIELHGRPAFGHFATQLEDCAAAIFENREPTIGGEAGVAALRALLEVYR